VYQPIHSYNFSSIGLFGKVLRDTTTIRKVVQYSCILDPIPIHTLLNTTNTRQLIEGRSVIVAEEKAGVVHCVVDDQKVEEDE
jgi:hypothetical protein